MSTPIPILDKKNYMNNKNELGESVVWNTIYKYCFKPDKFGDVVRHYVKVQDATQTCPVGYNENKPGQGQYTLLIDPKMSKNKTIDRAYLHQEYMTFKDANRDLDLVLSGQPVNFYGGKGRTVKRRMMGKGTRKLKRKMVRKGSRRMYRNW